MHGPRSRTRHTEHPRASELAASDSVSLKKVVDVFYDKVGALSNILFNHTVFGLQSIMPQSSYCKT